MRVATWNVNSLRVRLPHLLRWLEKSQTDVVCLQETKLTDDLFPVDALRAAGWEHLAWWGEPTYNGVAIVSRLPLEDVQMGFDDPIERDDKRVISATVDGVRVIGIYVPNGQRVGSPKFAWKLKWLAGLRAWLSARHTPDEPVLLCGDLNIAPDDLDVWDPFEFDGVLLCHPGERARFQQLLDWGFTDAYRARNRFANGFTWWDYQQMGWQRGHGMRIDLVLLSAPLLARCEAVQIWSETRGWDQPSDHAPVSVDLR